MRMKAIAAVILSLALWSTTAPPASAESPDYVVLCDKRGIEGIDTVSTSWPKRSEAISAALACVKTGGSATVFIKQ